MFSVKFDICFFLGDLLYQIENGKKSYKPCDDVINLQKIIKMYSQIGITSAETGRSETWYFWVFHAANDL